MAKDIAPLAGGCFWRVEAVVDHLLGVKRVASSYIRGTLDAASYKPVCDGTTGYAEGVPIVFRHQEYFKQQNSANAYCMAVVAPGLHQSRRSYAERLKRQTV